MFKIVSAAEAAAMVKDEDTIVFNAFGGVGFPEELARAIGERYKAEGSPANMTFIHGGGQGMWNVDHLIDLMSLPGMVKRDIGAHPAPQVQICRAIMNNEIEGYNYSMGVVSQNMRASASGQPGLITKIGLKTFIDPRHGGGALNDISKEEMVKLIEIEGEEYLFYPAFKPDIALLRGTTVDPKGNITMEKEAINVDAFSCAMATRHNGGKVIVQVERQTTVPANPHLVKIPGVLVDAVVINPEQKQTFLEDYNPTYTGEIRIPEDQVPAMIDKVFELNIAAGRKRERGRLHQVIARRAAQELIDGAIVNLGIGIPEMVPHAASDLGLQKKITLSLESGIIGGTPAPGLNFGASVNPDMVHDMAAQFDFYDGGMLDMTFVGAMQIARNGDVNVSKAGKTVIGVGGFTDLTQSAKALIYVFPFSSGGLKVDIKDRKLTILEEGKYPKFVNQLDQLSASAEFSLDINQKVLYITERCVFDLTAEGIRLIEIAPGIDLEKDILSKMEYCPLISDKLKVMDEILFDV